ncbi:MAG: MBL fold metallo-hydrolase [Chloroflexi bacterium]|jgi:glyoxylase-like metal-dependent hydrolase (beta-lactamase superfamily II)|nr:MBL fold metallo-hydrolase [Chloroflexota bacterium]
MQKERVSENVYWFQSDIYARVTAGAIIGPQWAVLIDTLMPEETPYIKHFLESELMIPVRYVINTHHHADHSWGNCLFPDATIIGHDLCRHYMVERSTSALAEAIEGGADFKDICIMPPDITVSNGSLFLRIGKKQIQIFSSPGHSDDSISVLLEEDKILFAGDSFMPIPFFVGGDFDILLSTLQRFGEMSLENVIQGHGDIILRGEIEEKIQSNVDYLNYVKKIVRLANRRRYPYDFLAQQDIEDAGKNRILLGGIADALHQRNLAWLYYKTFSED